MLLLVPLLLLTPAPTIMDRIIEVLRPHVAILVLLADRHVLPAAAVRSGTADSDTDAAEFVAHVESKNPPPAPPPSGADAVICCRLRRRKGTVRAAREVMFLPTTSQIDTGPFGHTNKFGKNLFMLCLLCGLRRDEVTTGQTTTAVRFIEWRETGFVELLLAVGLARLHLRVHTDINSLFSRSLRCLFGLL